MEKVNVVYSGVGFQTQDLDPADRQLIVSNFINSAFGAPNDYLEIYIYSETDALLEVDYDAFDYYPYLTANPKNNTYSSLVLDPETDLKNRGYNRGNLKIQYNFYKRLFNSSQKQKYWIKEISTSRTELRLASQTISNSSIIEGFAQYEVLAGSRNYFPVFYLNFGENQTVIATNVAYTEDDQGGYLIVKLYEPLPSDVDVKRQLWIVDKVAESVQFSVSIETEAETTQQLDRLRGPNYNVLINKKNGQTTPYYTYDSLLMSPVSSSFQKLMSYYQDKAMQINIDYSDFKNFVHFSSAVERVNNFVYKLELIENANAAIAEQQTIIGGGSAITASITAEQKAIDNIIKNFDTYEYYLYFESSSWAWPKSTSTQPYSLYSITSSQATNFLGGIDVLPTPTTQSLLWSASYYDGTNKDLLHNSIPQYLLDDPANAPYITFLDMIGQHFDNIWIYYKDITNRYNATNNPNTGISLDMVSDALKGLGFELYTNSNVSDNLYYTLFGINADGGLLPPTGSELITNYVTSSLTTLPSETIQDELYKRIYHNLPYLLKSKGTARGVKALISTFGIPESILTIREFGGNYIGSLDGILDLDSSNYKVAIATGSGGSVTGSLTISSSLLSPYTTIQYYEGNTRLNSTNVEVGFSPADVINSNISASQGLFSLDQLIGSPALQYSSSYTPLVSASNAYFASYTQPNSIWEYIRLLKFYNNTLFKTVKDFIPARANISTGIIVKSHMYERNKYPRHEPNITFNDYSQSIEILDLSADSGGAITDPTAQSGFIMTPLGLASYSSSQNQTLYTGELSGSQIVVTDGFAMEQGDYTSYTTGAVELYNYGALYQNISSSVRSQNFIDLDYNSNQLVPVNYGLVTYSLDLLNTNAYAAYTNPNNPFAQLQDYNYFLQRSTIPRYAGSETISALYNTYTEGDQSYGKTAAIDKIKYQYAYLVDIYSASQYLPGRSNAQIKYIIDNDENVLDLTKANKNIFDVQNIFKSGETTNISLFDYDETNPYTQKLANDPSLAVYEGGWRYLPIYHNVSRSSTQLFEFSSYAEEINSSPNPSPYTDPANYTVLHTCIEVDSGFGYSDYTFQISIKYIGSGTLPYDINVVYSESWPDYYNRCTTPINMTFTLLQGSFANFYYDFTITVLESYPSSGNGNGQTPLKRNIIQFQNGTAHYPVLNSGGYYSLCNFSRVSISAPNQAGTTYITYLTEFTSSQSCLYYTPTSNEVVFNTTMSFWYQSQYAPLIFSSTSDTDFTSSGLPPVITPFEPAPGDKISFYSSLGVPWSELSEYTIKNLRITGSTDPGDINLTSSVLLAEMVEPVNLLLFSSGSGIPTESITGAPYRICRYVVWKRVPDETNVILRYNPRNSNLVENGILFPEYIDQTVRENAGNVITSLKQQNLI